MNKIESLIDKLCPNGVEFRNLGEVCEYIRGITYDKNQEISNNADSCECWKVLRANNIDLQHNRLNFDDIKLIQKIAIDEKKLLKENDILICAGSGSKEHIGKVAFIESDMDFTFGGFMGVVRILNQNLNARFLFFYLASDFFTDYLKTALNSSTINNLSLSIMQNFKIPIPPIEIQNEIVKVLDSFTQLQTQLQTELQARKKQYAYYRNKLLSIKELQKRSNDVKIMNLGEVCEILDNKRKPISKHNRIAGEFPYYGANGIMDYVNDYIFDGDFVLIGEDGSVINDDGTPVLNFASGKFWLNNHAHILSSKTNSIKFIYYALSCCKIDNFVNKGIGAKLNQNDLKQIKIPIPPIEIQNEIVKILDSFDKLVNDLTSGIPAEITARQKQYEYYREKLLSFKNIAE